MNDIAVADYDRSRYDYRKYWANRQYEDAAERLALKKLLPRRGQSIIDIGGGYGRLINLYINRFDSVTLFDFSQKSLNRAPNYSNLTKVQGDIYQLPFKDASFEVALVIRLIHHLHEPQQALQEISRVLTPGGILILEFPNKLHLKNRLRYLLKGSLLRLNTLQPLDLSGEAKGIFYNYHPQHIRQMLKKSGFEVLEKISVSNWRLPLIKRLAPLPLLLTLEQILQTFSYLPFLKNHFYLAPSIFLKCQKRASFTP